MFEHILLQQYGPWGGIYEHYINRQFTSIHTLRDMLLFSNLVVTIIHYS